MSYNANGNDSKPAWLQRFGPKIGMGAGFGAVGFLLGRAFSVPGTTAFWDLAAQPIATLSAGAGAITAGYLAFHNGEKSRALEAGHHRETIDRERESDLQDRYTAAAKQLGDDNSAIREAGTYAIAALADDWLRYGTLTKEAESAHSQARACVNLLCSYLRGNRRVDERQQFEREEAAVRNSIVSVFRERTNAWHTIEEVWIAENGLSESSRIVLDLSGAMLANANFSHANLQRARLDDAVLSGANFHSANLRSAYLPEADLVGAKLVGTDFTGAHLFGTDFTKATAPTARFNDANADDAIFTAANLRSARFRGASLIGTKFHRARLVRSTFADADLGVTDFCAAHLGAAVFTGCRGLEESKFNSGTRYTPETKWEGSFVPVEASLVPTLTTFQQKLAEPKHEPPSDSTVKPATVQEEPQP